MKPAYQRRFILEKIVELQTAILYFHTDGILPVASAVISTTNADEKGNLLITVEKPMHLEHIKHDIHVSLNYYRKGQPFFLNTNGLAKLISLDEISQYPLDIKDKLQSGQFLMRVQLSNANYYEIQHPYVSSFVMKCWQVIINFITGQSKNYYHFQFDEKPFYA